MSNWKSASEMFAYTKQNIEARDSMVDCQMPYYMDKVMERIMNRAGNCEYSCGLEIRPEKGEEMELFDLIIAAVRKKLKSLGYSVTNNQTRFGIKVSWGSNSNDPQNY
jgi:hypothetical protein